MENDSKDEKISAAMRLARAASGYTQSRAAELLGIKQAHLSMIERGQRRLTAELALKMAKLYKLDSGLSFMFGEDQELNGNRARAACEELVELAEQTGSAKLVMAVQNYICICCYTMLRKLYLSNPHNTEKIFKVKDKDGELAEMMLKELEWTVRFAEKSPDVDRRKIEPQADGTRKFLQVVDDCESCIPIGGNPAHDSEDK